LELQLRQQEQQLHHQRQQQQQQQQQHHPPQSALHQILTRHHQREQSQHQASQHSHEDARRRIEQHHSNLFPHWSPQLLQAQAQNRLLPIHQARYAAALQQEGGGPGSHENGSKTDSQQPDLVNLQRLLQLHQIQQNPMLALGQSNHSNPLSSLMGLASSTGSGISPALLAQLESLNGANRSPTPGDQQTSDLSALINAQSLLGYANGAGSGGVNGNSLFHHNNGGGGNSATADRTHSPHNLPQHPGVSDAMALLHAMQRDNGSSQHGFGGPERQG
jgi:hypothetical protein